MEINRKGADAAVKRMLFGNLLALLCAVAVFGGSAVFAASNVDTVESKEQSAFDDNFIQPQEPGIAEILRETDAKESSSGTQSSPAEETASVDSSSEAVSSQPASSTAVSSEPASSQPASSEPAEAAPVSSEPPPASSREPASSEPTSEPTSSEEVSSGEGTSSEETASSEEVSSAEEPPEESEEPASSEEEPDDNWEDFSDPDEALLDLVAGAVQREIIGINTPPSPACEEAYKAQAVAVHTYMEYHRRRTGSYPSTSYAAPMPRTVELVREVLDRLVCYNGAPINASYHAASGGHTQSAVYVWGNEVPYLAAVESAYDDYDSSFTISVSELEERLANAGIWTDGDPEDWFDLAGASYTDGGFIDAITICGTAVSGRTLREGILGAANLKSPKILAIDCDGEDFTFYTKGFGHGVGLSQQGALGYASREGWDYESILAHYYPGTEIE